MGCSWPWKGARDSAEEAAGAAAAEKVGMAVKEVISVQPYAASENRHLHFTVGRAHAAERFRGALGWHASAPWRNAHQRAGG